MKHFILAIVITLFCSSCFVGCAVYSTATSNKWLEYELPPSKILNNGAVFFEEKLSDGSNFSVFYDSEIEKDGEFYYAILMQDLGWTRNGDTWSAPQSSRTVKRGHIYINPKRGVAIYFYPEKHFSAFRASISTGNANH